MRLLLDSPLHRIPTLWSLYRPLLSSIRSIPLALSNRQILHKYIKDTFKRNRKLSNFEHIKMKWIEAEQLLYQLESCHNSSIHLSRTQELASHLLLTRSVSSHPPLPPSPSRTPQAPRPRPSILHSTQFAPPMLRVKPQPVQTSMMIFNRRRKSQKRYDKLELAKEYVGMMGEEESFLRRVRKREEGERWGEEWREWMREARGKEKREQERNNMRIPPKLQARANRIGLRESQQRQKLARETNG
ncbi:hypothetical protein JCM5353_002243 [Sporobolomyces roseus]